jgi:hypothetical protein
MEIEHKFTATQLATINEQASIYMCACPVQVSKEINSLRKLFDYQYVCLKNSNGEVQSQVHERIAEASQKAHQIMEQCLDEVLDIEGWDRTTLAMPEGLRELMEQYLDNL